MAPQQVLVDVVVVAYNSRAHLRACTAPFTQMEGVRVIVVDNASVDRGLDTVSDLPLLALAQASNRGFAAGCNVGWRAGAAPFVLFLNPDATIDERSLRRLAAVLEDDVDVAAAAPRIERADGTLAWSQRRFPRLRATYARAFFLHRLLPRASWTDDIVRDPSAYERRSSPDWVSGACLLVRRTALDAIGGWDEGFFLYGEDIDLCRRLRARGWELVFEPSARVVHAEGASAPRSSTLPLLAASRIRYDRKHRGRIGRVVDRAGIALSALTHVVVSRGGRTMRLGHVQAFGVATSLRRSP